MADKILFYYFGDDDAYYRTLVAEFKTTTRLSLDFECLFESEEKKIQSLFLQIAKNRPACVFIDFSKHTQDYLHLARIISRTPMGYKFVTVGLVDYLSPSEILLESIATGVNLTHIKGAESFDVVFDVTKLIAPNEIGEHGFATATLKEEGEAGILVKVGFVSTEGLHFETDFPLQKGDRIRLNHHWLVKKIVPSKDCFVQAVTTSNLYYHFRTAVDAEFLFMDEFLPPEGMELDRIEERKKDRDAQIISHKKQLSRWVDDNLSRSFEKKAKVLVVDREFHFYDMQPRTDRHAYTIRCVPFIEDIGIEIDRMKPQVIAFAMEKPDQSDAKNTLEKLTKLVEALKVKMKDNPPFLVVFNSEVVSKSLQEKLKYPLIMATADELSVELLLRMADIFEKKLKTTTEMTIPAASSAGPKVYLTKSNMASIAEIMIPIKIVKLSESDMIIQSDVALTIGMNLHLTEPVDMFVNIQPPPKGQSKTPEYQGLIHSLREDQKKKLRQFVNAVFFREHDAKVTADTESFKQLNEAKLIAKQEALKKAQEEKQSDTDSEDKSDES